MSTKAAQSSWQCELNQLTRVVGQDSAAKRLIGKPNIFSAAINGDTTLIIDHTTANLAAVHEKDIKYHPMWSRAGLII